MVERIIEETTTSVTTTPTDSVSVTDVTGVVAMGSASKVATTSCSNDDNNTTTTPVNSCSQSSGKLGNKRNRFSGEKICI